MTTNYAREVTTAGAPAARAIGFGIPRRAAGRRQPAPLEENDFRIEQPLWPIRRWRWEIIVGSGFETSTG